MYGPTGTEYKCDVLIGDGKKKATKIGSVLVVYYKM